MIKERKVKYESLTKENTNHEIKLKKLPKKAENKYYVYNCFLYIERKKIESNQITWYILDRTHPEVYANLTEAGTLVVDIEGLRDKHGSITIVAKYNKKQYYHILKRWRDNKKTKNLALGLGLGIGIPVLAGAIAGIVVGAQSCSNQNNQSNIDIRTNPGNNIYTDQVVTTAKNVVLGSFRLIDNEGNVISENKTSELTVAFTSPNQTGFTNNDLYCVFNHNDNTYQVSLVNGKAASESCSGGVTITWKDGDKIIESSSQLDVHVIDVSKKTLIQKIYGPDCKTEYDSEQVVPVVVGSGIYLELNDPTTNDRIDATWMVLGGGADVELLNVDEETPINALMINNAPDEEITITVKAFPVNFYLYNDAVFNIKIVKSTTDPIITAKDQSEYYLLQHQSTQAVIDDTIAFTLNNETATEWDVTAATGGDRSDPAKITDVSFNNNDPDGILTINKNYVVGATYTIQAKYGSNLTTKFNLLLTAGGVINATIKNTSSGTASIEKNKQLSNDLAINDILTFTLSEYDAPIEYWTAVYDARTPYSVPGFTSPTTGNKKTAVWKISQNDMDAIPAGSHIYINAYKENSNNPVASFIFQTKSHVLTSMKYDNVACPITRQNSEFWGCSETLDKTKFTALLDAGTNPIAVDGTIIQTVSNDYRVENTDTETTIIVQKGGRANVIAPIELSYHIPNSGVRVVNYTSICCYDVWDLYSFDKKESAHSVDLNIPKENYINTSSESFVLYKNGEPCTDDAGITWTKGTITNVDLDNGPANATNYDIAYDNENKCWKINFTANGSAPSAIGQSGTLTFTAKYPGSSQPQTDPTYPFPVITINIKTV